MRRISKAALALIVGGGLMIAGPAAADAQVSVGGVVLPSCGAGFGKVEQQGSKVRATGYGICNDQKAGASVNVTLYETRGGTTRKVATSTCLATPTHGCTARTKFVTKANGARYSATNSVQLG